MPSLGHLPEVKPVAVAAFLRGDFTGTGPGRVRSPLQPQDHPTQRGDDLGEPEQLQNYPGGRGAGEKLSSSLGGGAGLSWAVARKR